MVDRVGGDGEDGAGREVVSAEGDAWPGGNDAREAEGGGGVDAQGFVDGVVEAGGMVSRTDTVGWGQGGEGRTRAGLSRLRSPGRLLPPGLLRRALFVAFL